MEALLSQPIRTVLKPGVALTTVMTDRFKFSGLTVTLFVPLRKETASAYSLAADVLMRGTEQYPTMQALNRRQDELYSLSLAAFTHKRGELQTFTAEATSIDDAFAYDGMKVSEEGMKLLNQLLFHPVLENGVFRRDYVEQEKKNLIDEIRSDINYKDYYAKKRCTEIMCEGEPYCLNVNGTEEDVLALDAETLTRHYRELLAASKVEIVYVGRKPHEEVASLVAEYLPFEPRSVVLPEPVRKAAPEKTRFVTEKMDVTQCQMIMGYRVRSQSGAGIFGHACRGLFGELFSNSPVSRLYMNVREKYHLCYSCFASIEPFKGVMSILCGLEKKNIETAKNAIEGQLAELREGRITEEELTAAKRTLISSLRETAEHPITLVMWYQRLSAEEACYTPEAMIEEIGKLTVRDVAAYASDIIPDTVYCLVKPGNERSDDQ